MKKKIFTLLSLLFCAVTASWAQTTVFSYDASESPITISPETATVTLNKCSQVDSDGKNGIKLDAADDYIKIDLPSGLVLAVDDIITITQFQTGTKDPNDNYGTYISSSNSTTASTAAVTIPSSQGKNSGSGIYTVLSSDELNGASSFYLMGKFPSGKNVYMQKIVITRPAAPTETYTVTFEAGSDGTCATSSLTEEEPGAGVVLPAVTNVTAGMGFSGWYTASEAGTKVGDAGDTYRPTSDITIYAQYKVLNTGTDLLGVKFSNGFEGFIKDDVVTAYYMDGESVPTVSAITPKSGSEGATFSVVGTTLTITAENGTTTHDLTLNLSSVSPVNLEDITFNGAEGWLKTGGAFNPTGKKGWTINKNTEDNSNKRISEGKNRIYFFVENASKITVYPSTTSTSNRNVSYTVNDGAANTASFPKYSKGTESFDITTGAKSMVGITNLGSGDLSFRKIVITGLASPQETVTISTGTGKTLATYVASQDLDFTTQSSAITAYVATSASADAVTLESVSAVPAGTPILVKTASAGANVDVDITTGVESIGENLLLAGDGTTNIGGDSKYDYILKDGLFHRVTSASALAAGKAYLHLDEAPSSAHELLINFEDAGTTGIKNVDIVSKNDGEFYNLAGQRVVLPARGLYIVNGKKVIIK